MSTNPVADRMAKTAREHLASLVMLSDFPTILRKAREECGITQSEVASACGVAREAVSQWESGTIRPSSDSLIKLGLLFSRLTPLIKTLEDNRALKASQSSDESVIDLLRAQHDVLMEIKEVLVSLSQGRLL